MIKNLHFSKIFQNTKFPKCFSTNFNKTPVELVFKQSLDNKVAKSNKIYLDMINKHYRMSIPFIDDEFYLDLFNLTKQIENNNDLDSWVVLENYFKLNLERLSNDIFAEVIEEFGKIKYFRFEFWYLIEKNLHINLHKFNNNQLARIIYSFAYAEKGSNYLFKLLVKEVLDRKIRNFNEEEFIMIYNGFKIYNIKDKLLNAMLEKAKEELFSHLNL